MGNGIDGAHRDYQRLTKDDPAITLAVNDLARQWVCFGDVRGEFSFIDGNTKKQFTTQKTGPFEIGPGPAWIMAKCISDTGAIGWYAKMK
jgi:hypothetical protein